MQQVRSQRNDKAPQPWTTSYILYLCTQVHKQSNMRFIYIDACWGTYLIENQQQEDVYIYIVE